MAVVKSSNYNNRQAARYLAQSRQEAHWNRKFGQKHYVRKRILLFESYDELSDFRDSPLLLDPCHFRSDIPGHPIVKRRLDNPDMNGIS